MIGRRPLLAPGKRWFQLFDLVAAIALAVRARRRRIG